jgi:hypothetical protein
MTKEALIAEGNKRVLVLVGEQAKRVFAENIGFRSVTPMLMTEGPPNSAPNEGENVAETAQGRELSGNGKGSGMHDRSRG